MSAEPLQIDRATYDERQTLLARSALIALTAEEQHFNSEVHDQTMSTLGLNRDDYVPEMWKLDEAGRVRYTIRGLVPTAGTFPETEFEHRVRTELVAPIVDEVQRMRALRSRAGPVLRDFALREVSGLPIS